MEKKFKELKGWAAKKWDQFTDWLAKAAVWCVQNWQVVLALLSAAGGVLKFALKVRKNKADEEYKNRRFYDRRTDRWCYANRHLSRKQQDMIERRYLDGETYRSILSDMGLLK